MLLSSLLALCLIFSGTYYIENYVGTIGRALVHMLKREPTMDKFAGISDIPWPPISYAFIIQTYLMQMKF